MKNKWLRLLFQLLEFNIVAIAFVAPVLFVAALLGWLGYLPDDTSVNVMGRVVGTDGEYHAYMASTAALGVIGWVYVWLRVKKMLR